MKKRIRVNKYNNYTFARLAKLDSGTLVYDEEDGDFRFIILRGPGALCAYMGVPKKHPLAGESYDTLPIDTVHGGLTYGSDGENNKFRPKGYYWYGWDYAHAGDNSFYNLSHSQLSYRPSGRKWTVKTVIEDSREAVRDFKILFKMKKVRKVKTGARKLII